MKKIVSIALALLMMLACASAVFATEYIKSPTNEGSVKLISFTCSDPNFKGRVVITDYNHRHLLGDIARNLLELAFGRRNSIPANKGTASEVFDISTIDENGKVVHIDATFTITFAADSITKFVSLMHFNGTDWEDVNTVTADKSKAQATFSGNDFSPYMLVVEKGSGSDEPQSPQTDDIGVYFLAAGCVLVFGAIAFLAVSRKKSFEK